MATNNEQSFNQDYKYRYSEEISLLDELEHGIIEAANNLDIDKIETLISSFEGKYYNALRTANKQSFDMLKSNVVIVISKIKKEKELAARKAKRNSGKRKCISKSDSN